MSASAIGCVGVETQRGQIIPGRRSTSATIVSNAALPAPITIAARSIVTGTDPTRAHRRLGAATQVRRQIRRLVAEAAQIDDLSQSCPPLRRLGDRLRAAPRSCCAKSSDPSE